MDYHLERRVVFSNETKYKNLYDWCLRELDGDGKQIGPDLIPWNWNLYFTASELELSDTFSIEQENDANAKPRAAPARASVQAKPFIKAKLQPGRTFDRQVERAPRYSMFGTERPLNDFELFIEPLEDGAAQEHCWAWGSVSYTTEIDFRDETSADLLIFYLYVSPERFAKYRDMIANSAVDMAYLRVSGVSGFYADWSPGVTTNSIKVLTSHREHNVKVPTDAKVTLSSLGHLSEVEFHVRRITKLQMPADEDNWLEQSESDEPGGAPSNNSAGLIALRKFEATGDQAVKALVSLRAVGWVIAGLLLMNLFT